MFSFITSPCVKASPAPCILKLPVSILDKSEPLILDGACVEIPESLSVNISLIVLALSFNVPLGNIPSKDLVNALPDFFNPTLAFFISSSAEFITSLKPSISVDISDGTAPNIISFIVLITASLSPTRLLMVSLPASDRTCLTTPIFVLGLGAENGSSPSKKSNSLSKSSPKMSSFLAIIFSFTNINSNIIA